MLLREALDNIPNIKLKGNLDASVQGISYDSRLVKKGHLFVAIKGEKADGADFVQQAVDRGAVAVASEKPVSTDPQVPSIAVANARIFLADVSRLFYGDPASKLKLVGITGTNGKTTTAWMMESLFASAGLHCCLAGTLGMRIGTRTFASERTTPEAPDLLRFLDRAVNDGCTHGVMEVSSHSLVLRRVFGVKFTVGVFMNLTRDHLDFHNDMETYFQAKKMLFSPGNRNQVEQAVINTDDPFGKRLAGEADCPVMSFGFREPAEIRVLEYQSRANGMDLDLATPKGRIRFRSELIGHPNAYNIMAATGAALYLNIDPVKIQNGIEALKEVPGRLELVDAGQDFTVIVDYAHSPDALENLLQTVSQLPHARIITVFGCGGDRDRTKRPIMGEVAANMNDMVLVTSDNPRSEDPHQILADIEPGLKRGSAAYEIIPDRRRAIDCAISMARKGDVVVIAGKGHEDYQIIGNRVVSFDDRKQARELIEKRLESDKADGRKSWKSFQTQ